MHNMMTNAVTGITLAFSLSVGSACSVDPSGNCMNDGQIDPSKVNAELAKIQQALTANQTELEKGCTLYSNVLETTDEMHYNGKVKTSQADIAKGAYQGILKEIYIKTAYDPVTGELDENAAIFSDPDTKEGILALKLGETVLTIPSPEADMDAYTEHCAYLDDKIVTLAGETEFSVHELYEFAINGALHVSRDPHTSYLAPEKAERLKADTKGEFGGLGIEVGMKDGVVEIKSPPFEGTPAEAVGLQAGDLIEKLDEKPVRGMTLDEAVTIMRGEKGTDITLVVRRGDAEPFEVPITRDTIIIKGAKGKIVGTNNDYAHIEVKSFSNRTLDDLELTFVKLKKQIEDSGKELQGVILDVRGNPGGNLKTAKEISDAFLAVRSGEKPYPMVTVKEPRQSDVTEVDTVFDGVLTDKPVVLLQNEGSASASEIVAGALQDSGVPVIGVPSFGKGSVQIVLPLTESGQPLWFRVPQSPMLKVTTGAFFPGKTVLSNQGAGIIPNIEVHYNDARDDMKKEARRESGLKNTLLPPEETRAHMEPKSTCTLKEEFAGALSEEQIAAIPENMVKDTYLKGEQKDKPEKAKVYDADLGCALNWLEGTSPYTSITPKQKTVLAPGS